jgi:hypothetical protein
MSGEKVQRRKPAVASKLPVMVTALGPNLLQSTLAKGPAITCMCSSVNNKELGAWVLIIILFSLNVLACIKGQNLCAMPFEKFRTRGNKFL